jgi:hypothetical protein
MSQDTIYCIMYAIGTPLLLVMLFCAIHRERKSPPPPRKRILPSDEWCEAARKWRD